MPGFDELAVAVQVQHVAQFPHPGKPEGALRMNEEHGAGTKYLMDVFWEEEAKHIKATLPLVRSRGWRVAVGRGREPSVCSPRRRSAGWMEVASGWLLEGGSAYAARGSSRLPRARRPLASIDAARDRCVVGPWTLGWRMR